MTPMMKQMIYIFLLMMISPLILSAAWAEDAQVPAQDTITLPPAEVVEPLEAIDVPNWTAEKTVAGEDFALFLMNEGDFDSAILEWRRVYFESVNPNLKARALFSVGEMYYKKGDYSHALQTFEKFGEKYPQHEHIPHALYYMVLSADALKLPEAPLLMTRMTSLYPQDPLTEKASYTLLYKRALEGKDNLEADINSARALKLIERLKAYPVRDEKAASISTLMSVIPGLGHLYLGDIRSAASAFFINIIFIAALLGSLRRKYWAYASVFGLIVSILYAGTMFSAHSLTYREGLEKRIAAMKKWPDLNPEAPNYSNLLEEGKAKGVAETSALKPMEVPLWFYRNVLGKFDGDHGGGTPVSSLYMRQAIAQYGVTLGTLMGVDRLIRDWREIEKPVAQTFADGRLRYIDPLSRNSFWLES